MDDGQRIRAGRVIIATGSRPLIPEAWAPYRDRILTTDEFFELEELPGSVAPVILRGVTLYGIDSVMAPLVKRIDAWNRLAQDLDLELLEGMTHEIGLDQLPATAEAILEGRVRGRTLVKLPD
mgnify:CR=1 FL=1